MLLNGSTLSERQIAYIAREILQGLEYLHEMKIIHRDIKAANVLITEKGEVKLADFGVSQKIISTLFASRDAEQAFVGTPLYMVCFPCD